MIRIYDKEEKQFKNLGLGSLDETIAAVVVEELNGGYEMEMEYPITGRHFDKIQHRNIILCKPNMYSDPQPFRIYSITKPINGIVVINAEHISYDANGVTILPKRDSETKTIESFGDKVTVDDKEGYYLDTILRDINLSSAIQDKNRFEVSRGSDKENVFKEDGYKIPAPLNLRSMLGGMSGSILEQFKGEYEFDKYNIILHNKRGVDRGITIRYGKNMTDLEHESEANNLFTAIFPFYSKSYTETQTTTKPIFQDTYIIDGVTPRRADWLSIELLDVSKGIGGISLKPVVELMKVLVDGVENLVERYAPVIVKTPDDPEGTDEFYNKIYVFKRNKVDEENPELTNLFDVYVSEKHTDIKIINGEEKTVEVIDEIKLDPDDVNAIVPQFGNIYVVKSDDSEHYNRSIIWDNGQFVEYSSDGFYVEAKDATTVPESKKLPTPIPIYPISWDELNETWVKDIQNGWIYVTPKRPYVGTISVDKYIYLDLLEYTLPDGSTTLLENGVIYVNDELKNLDNQKVLTLDMTEALDSIGGLEPTQMTQEHLFDKAEQYLKDNDLTKMKESVTISFIKLSDSPEYAHLKQLEIVELGDEINVIYEDLGINSKHRVISTEYNVLTDSYNEIELGDKVSKITSNVVSVGDNISSLKNDEEFANKTYVVDFVAENAKIINAEIQNAIINTLEAAHVNISNSLTASSAAIDQLVAEMLVSENAKISELLEAGSVRVRGKITALSGEIGGAVIEDGLLQVPMAQIIDLDITYATVTALEAAEARIDTIEADYIVTSQLEAAEARIDTIEADYIVTSQLEAAEARIDTIEADYITTDQLEAAEARIDTIEADYIVTSQLEAAEARIDTIEADYITTDQLEAAEARIDTIEADYITTDELTAYEINADKIVGGTISSSTIDIGSGNFMVDSYGNVDIKSGEIKLGAQTPWFEHGESNYPERYFYVDSVVIEGLTLYRWLSDDEIYNANPETAGNPQYLLTETRNVGIGDVVWGYQLADDGTHGDFLDYEDKPHLQRTIINVGEGHDYNFVVDEEGNATIKQGSIKIGGSEVNPNFEVDNQGNVTARSIEIIDGDISGGTIDIGDGNFKVNADGDVTIDSGSIELGGGNFRVDNLGNVVMSGAEVVMNASGYGGSVMIGDDGVLRAENVEISGSIETDILDVQEIQFNDGLITIKPSDESETTSQTISVSTSLGLIIPGPSYVVVNANASTPTHLPSPRTVTLYFSYREPTYGGGFIVNNSSIPITISGNQGSASVNIPYLGNPPSGFNKTGQSPSSFSFYTTTGTVNLGVDKTFVPLETDTYDLGSSGRRWDNIYATNTIIQTSDRRQKEAINYDISLYEALFDKLKPVSYKFINGKSGRTHMGFISQDIRDALNELSIPTEDFAGFVKTLLNSSKEKAPEDLTEEDYTYGIRYGELHALQVQQIQLLKKQVKELAEKLAALENNSGGS